MKFSRRLRRWKLGFVPFGSVLAWLVIDMLRRAVESDTRTATTLELLLAGSIAAGVALMHVNLWWATRDLGWVEARQQYDTDGDWTASVTEAWTRWWQMLILTAVQLIFFAIALRLVVTVPVGTSVPRPPLTLGSQLTQLGLIAIEYLLIALSLLMLWRRYQLVGLVRRAGGD